jgi:2-dehydropantoate 2-reductase
LKILVYGAGVIGTLYAARLQQAGHRVTVLARSQRLADIERHGLVVEDVVSGVQSTTQVALVDRLHADHSYDLALIAVRRDQLPAILPELAANRNIPALLFLVNNPLGSAWLIEALGKGRVVPGFPGAGGTLEGHAVRYAMIAQQPTTLGEPGGLETARLRGIAAALRAAGFETRLENDMDTWLSAHAFFVTAVGGAIYLAGGDCERLSRSRPVLESMVDGVREGFGAVRALGRRVRPFALRVLFTWLPRPLAVRYWQRFFSKPMAEYVFGGHVRRAAQEMRAIAADCRVLLERSGVATPALDRLYRAIAGFQPAREPNDQY